MDEPKTRKVAREESLSDTFKRGAVSAFKRFPAEYHPQLLNAFGTGDLSVLRRVPVLLDRYIEEFGIAQAEQFFSKREVDAALEIIDARERVSGTGMWQEPEAT